MLLLNPFAEGGCSLSYQNTRGCLVCIRAFPCHFELFRVYVYNGITPRGIVLVGVLLSSLVQSSNVL